MAIKKVDLQIKGMTCTSRAQRVEKDVNVKYFSQCFGKVISQ